MLDLKDYMLEKNGNYLKITFKESPVIDYYNINYISSISMDDNDLTIIIYPLGFNDVAYCPDFRFESSYEYEKMRDFLKDIFGISRW